MSSTLTAYGMTYLIPDGCTVEVEDPLGEHDHAVYFGGPRFRITLDTEEPDREHEKEHQGESSLQSQFTAPVFGENTVYLAHYTHTLWQFGHEAAAFYSTMQGKDGAAQSVYGLIAFDKGVTINEGYAIPELHAIFAGMHKATPEEQQAAQRTDA